MHADDHVPADARRRRDAAHRQLRVHLHRHRSATSTRARSTLPSPATPCCRSPSRRPAINAAAVVGSPTTTSMLLTNRSSSPITLTSLLFSGAAATDYSLAVGNTCTPALALAPSTSCTLVVGFNPPAAGTRNATLTITHSAAGSPQTVAFLGTATPAPQGRIELSSSALTYPDTQLASTTAQTVTVHNGGNLALNFSAFTLGGTNPGDFQRSGTCAVGTPLPIAADCTVILTFAPTALGLRTAHLVDRLRRQQRHGRHHAQRHRRADPGAAGQPDADHARLRHADDRRPLSGAAHPPRQQRHRRPGGRLGRRQRHRLRDSPPPPARPSSRPAAGCDIDIALRADRGPGLHRRADRGQQRRRLAARLACCAAAAAPRRSRCWCSRRRSRRLDFGSVSAGSVSAAQTVTVLNQGPGGATLTLLNAVGGDAASFSVVGGTCAIGTALFEGATCTISVQFAPGSSGTKTAQVQIASTGSFPPVLTLTGVGLAGPNPSLALSTARAGLRDTTRRLAVAAVDGAHLEQRLGRRDGQRDRRERHLRHRQHHLPRGAVHACLPAPTAPSRSASGRPTRAPPPACSASPATPPRRCAKSRSAAAARRRWTPAAAAAPSATRRRRPIRCSGRWS